MQKVKLHEFSNEESHREAKVKATLATALKIMQALASVVFILSVSSWNFRIKYEIGSEPEGGIVRAVQFQQTIKMNCWELFYRFMAVAHSEAQCY